MMEEQTISCEIIAAVGTAKSYFIEAIRAIRKKEYQKAEECIRLGQSAYEDGHKLHQAILTSFALGEVVNLDILLVHAECQMMSAEDFSIIAQEMLDDSKNY